MSGPVTVKFEGGVELAAAIHSMVDDFDVSKATVRNRMVRALMDAGQQTADLASQLAPDDPASPPPDLHTSIAVGKKLTGRQAGLHKKGDERSFAEAFVGATEEVNSYAHIVEFGDANVGPRPFMRPAWDATKDTVLRSITGFVKAQFDKAAARAAAKALRKAASS